MIRDMYSLELDPCDEYLITLAIILQWVVAILQCLGIIDNDSPLEDLVDIFYHLVMGCSLAQNQIELDYHMGK